MFVLQAIFEEMARRDVDDLPELFPYFESTIYKVQEKSSRGADLVSIDTIFVVSVYL